MITTNPHFHEDGLRVASVVTRVTWESTLVNQMDARYHGHDKLKRHRLANYSHQSRFHEDGLRVASVVTRVTWESTLVNQMDTRYHGHDKLKTFVIFERILGS